MTRSVSKWGISKMTHRYNNRLPLYLTIHDSKKDSNGIMHCYENSPFSISAFISHPSCLMCFEFVVGHLLCSKRFFSGWYSFPFFSKTSINEFNLKSIFNKLGTLKGSHYQKGSWSSLVKTSNLVTQSKVWEKKQIFHSNRWWTSTI